MIFTESNYFPQKLDIFQSMKIVQKNPILLFCIVLKYISFGIVKIISNQFAVDFFISKVKSMCRASFPFQKQLVITMKTKESIVLDANQFQ